MAEMDDHDPPTENAHYFDNAAFSDVTIHTDDCKELKLHRIILASSSEHFRKMFGSGFVESSSKDVHLKGDDPEALYGLLAWCYGLLYSDRRTFAVESDYSDPVYYGICDGDYESHLPYMANLYVAADNPWCQS